MSQFLPMNRQEMEERGWQEADFVYICGDAYVDHPSFGAAKSEGLEGEWLFTLHNPSVMPFLQYADNRELREKIFKGYINRGNNGNETDNNEIVKKLVTLRLEKAKLMGYADYASYVLEDRMAKNEENV